MLAAGNYHPYDPSQSNSRGMITPQYTYSMFQNSIAPAQQAPSNYRSQLQPRGSNIGPNQLGGVHSGLNVMPVKLEPESGHFLPRIGESTIGKPSIGSFKGANSLSSFAIKKEGESLSTQPIQVKIEPEAPLIQIELGVQDDDSESENDSEDKGDSDELFLEEEEKVPQAKKTINDTALLNKRDTEKDGDDDDDDLFVSSRL
jgi:hypothetical protein